MKDKTELSNSVEDLLLRAEQLLHGTLHPDISAGQEQPRLLQAGQIASDGSTRIFVRCQYGEKKLIVAAPATRSAAELAEADAAWNIGKHLFSRGVAVPELHGRDAESGMVLFTDLGDTRLYDVVTASTYGRKGATTDVCYWYKRVIDQLLVLQVEGGSGFQEHWCWDTPRYDKTVMLERESGYFLRALWQGLLKQPDHQAVHEEFEAIADAACEAKPDYFLHRDCQSRNIMVAGDALYFIDFQGGRLGPLGYDLASLLIDPYVALPLSLQRELVAYYCQRLTEGWGLVDDNFARHYEFLALQRNLQIVGAFAFLSSVRRKTFFTAYLAPALDNLAQRLEETLFADYHQLRAMVASAQRLLAKS